MTTWYLDPEGGNDANAGTSFALRKQTIASMTLAAGDAVRMIADYGAQNLGNGTWTDNSGTVTLASAQTLTLDNGETAWTPATNVTSSTYAYNRKQGTNALQLSLASAFTTGLVAYTAVSNLNLSAYSCVSLWLDTTGYTMVQGLQLALCSDSAGAVPLVTLPFPAWLIANASFPSVPIPILFENGGAALPSGVNSIAIYANSGKPYTGTFYIDNIIATTAYGAAGHVSHGCALGKNTAGEPEWYPIMSIDGTTVVLGDSQDYGTSTPGRKYRGTTETVSTYALSPLRTRMTANQSKITGANGTAASPITFTGGWDRTAMASQTGTSWLSGEFVQANGFNNANSYNWLQQTDSTIGYMGYSTAALNIGSGSGHMSHVLGIVNSKTPVNQFSSTLTQDYDLGNLVHNQQPLTLTNMQAGKFKLRVRRITGVSGNGYAPADYGDDASSDIAIGQIDNCTYAFSASGIARARIKGTVLKNNLTASVSLSGSTGGLILLDRPTLGDASFANFSSTLGQTIRCNNVAGNAWDNRVYVYGATQAATQGTVHGTTTQSLSLKLNDYQAFLLLPYMARIARIACFANKTITFKAWMQRSTQYVNAGIMVQAGSVAGIVDATAQGSAANATWEQVSLSFTPTENGVVDVFAYIAGQATASANGTIALFGDTSVSST